MPEFKPLTKAQAKLFARLETRLGRMSDLTLRSQDDFVAACDHAPVVEPDCCVCSMQTELAKLAEEVERLYTSALLVNTAEENR